MCWETFALVPKSNYAPTKSLARFAGFWTPTGSKEFEWVYTWLYFFQPSCFIPPSARPNSWSLEHAWIFAQNLRSVDQQLWMQFLQRWKPLGEDVTHKAINLTGLSPTLARGLPGTLSRCLEDLAWISPVDAHPACQMRGNKC